VPPKKKTAKRKPKRKGRIHVSIILDRTGSMEVIRDDTIGGFNTFLKEQKEVPGEATITLAQFDSQDPYDVVYDFAPIADARELTRETYVPRAATPLLDAMGRGINDVEKKIADLPKKDQPTKVVLVVITDGQENSSREFRKDQVTKMVEEKQEDGWQVVFLGADLDGIDDALTVGIGRAQTLAFDNTAAGNRAAYKSMSANLTAYSVADGLDFSFKVEDRAKQKAESKRQK
jgi:hypothetical protein